jgi:hypothetical protein
VNPCHCFIHHHPAPCAVVNLLCILCSRIRTYRELLIIFFHDKDRRWYRSEPLFALEEEDEEAEGGGRTSRRRGTFPSSGHPQLPLTVPLKVPPKTPRVRISTFQLPPSVRPSRRPDRGLCESRRTVPHGRRNVPSRANQPIGGGRQWSSTPGYSHRGTRVRPYHRGRSRIG